MALFLPGESSAHTITITKPSQTTGGDVRNYSSQEKRSRDGNIGSDFARRNCDGRTGHSKNGAPLGERHGKVKVTDATVLEIRKRHYDQGHTMPDLAREYCVPYYTVRDWCNMVARVPHEC